MTTEKSRETRLRRAAQRQGYRLMKSRTRDPRALDYNKYWLIAVNGSLTSINDLKGLDAVEAALYPDQYRSGE
jgi:hypothetical protein